MYWSLAFRTSAHLNVLYFSDDFSQKKRRLISVAVFLTIQGRVSEGIFVDERRHYGVLLFSMIIYACWLLSVFFSFFLGYAIGPPLATTLLTFYIDNKHRLGQMKIYSKILEYWLPEEKCVHRIFFFFLFLKLGIVVNKHVK